MLERQISIGLKISLLIIAIIVLHSVSNFAGHLGIISDLFILLGLIQSVRFLSNKDIREETIKNLEEFINIEDIKSFISNLITFITSDENDFHAALDFFPGFYSNNKDEDEEENNEESPNNLNTELL